MKRNLLYLVFVMLLSAVGHAQINSDEVYTFCHAMPIFPGGDSAYNSFLTSNLVIPEDVIKSNLDGTAVVQFVIEKDGALSSVEIKKSISKSMDDEIVRVFKAMPKWSPAKVSDSIVRYQYAIPIVVTQMDYMKFDSLVEYLDSSYQVVKQDVSSHYKVVKNEKKYFSVNFYLKNGTLVETYECTKLIPEIKHGRYKLYHDNQKVKTEGKFVKGRKQGAFDSYSKDGEHMSKEKYLDDQLHGPSIFYKEAPDSKLMERLYYYGTLDYEFITDTIVDIDPEIFLICEKSPTFIGGDEARIKFLKENLKYPNEARKSRIQGTVYISFIVEFDGTINKPVIRRRIGGGCDEEALRLVNLMPKWNPGKQRGKAIRCQFNLPIKFSEL